MSKEAPNNMNSVGIGSRYEEPSVVHAEVTGANGVKEVTDATQAMMVLLYTCM